MSVSRSSGASRAGLALIAGALALVAGIGPACAQISSFSVGTDQPTSYPSNLTSWPDEHVTFFPSPQANGFLVFGSSAVTGGMGGAVALQTQNLQTFNLATGLGYAEQVMNPPVAFGSCNPSYNAEFDENYTGPGTVVQDPTLPPGNLIMIYEAENHCPGGVNVFDYYATAGLARSSDNGKTWPQPVDNVLGGQNRYPILSIATPQPTNPANQQINLGNAIPTAFVDGNYMYVPYESFQPSANDGLIRVARANLITDNVGGTLQFHKWDNGAFSQPGIGGTDSGVMPAKVCPGNERQPEISRNDALGRYVMIFVCIYTAPAGQAAWYYSTATSLDRQNWTPPQIVTNSLSTVFNPCMGASAGGTQFDGWYPSSVSANATQGHTLRTGQIYFLNGCDGGSMRAFDYRNFTITGGFATHDFNGDGASDILWRNSNGNLGQWLMNRAAILQATTLGNVPALWSVVAQRDFTGNGDADILWRDTAGNIGMWLMNGSQIASSTVLGNVPANWSVAGTGDFNNDQKADILWRDTAGDVGIWFMNGAAIQQSAVVGNVSTNWIIAGADVSGDIFWRNTVTGEVGMWVMNGTLIAKTADFGIVPLNWTIAGVGDFDGNGSTDILWRDTSGNVGLWLMNGTQIMSSAVLGNVPLTWSIVQTGDYNGDTRSDILWVDTLGNVATWFMNGATVSSVTTYGNVGTAWSVQSLNAE